MKVESKTGPGHSIAAAGKGCSDAIRGQVRARVCAKTLIIAIIAGTLLSGCAVAMLGGAARSGGSSNAGGATTPPRAGTSGGTASQPASLATTDSSISAAVRSRLSGHATLRALKIGVDTHDGIVTLRGQVNSLADKSAAQAEARAVSGVKGVNNQLTVR